MSDILACEARISCWKYSLITLVVLILLHKGQLQWTIPANSKYQIVAVGESASITCIDEKEENISFIWKNSINIDEPLKSNESTGIEILPIAGRESHLNFSSSIFSHAGTYTCEKSSDTTDQRFNPPSAHLLVLNCSTKSNVSNSFVCANEYVETTCLVSYAAFGANGSVQLKQNSEVIDEKEVVANRRNHTEILRRVVLAEKLKSPYSCEFVATFHNSTSFLHKECSPLNLTVIKPVSYVNVSSDVGKLMSDGGVETLLVGDSLYCTSDGYPVAYNWSVTGTYMYYANTTSEQQLRFETTGNYSVQCFARNTEYISKIATSDTFNIYVREKVLTGVHNIANIVGAALGGVVGFCIIILVATALCVRKNGYEFKNTIRKSTNKHPEFGTIPDVCSGVKKSKQEQGRKKNGSAKGSVVIDESCEPYAQIIETNIDEDKNAIYSEICREPKLQSIDDDVVLVDNVLYSGSNLATCGDDVILVDNYLYSGINLATSGMTDPVQSPISDASKDGIYSDPDLMHRTVSSDISSLSGQ